MSEEKEIEGSTRAERKLKQLRTRRIVWFIILAALGYFFLTVPLGKKLLEIGLPVIGQVALLGTFQVVQIVFYFGFMMYFLSGTRMEKVMPGDAASVTLTNDFHGLPKLKEYGYFLCDVLRGVGKLRAMGGEPFRGGVLTGPPGTGKTYFAKCVAGEIGIPFLMMDASQLVSMFLGMGGIKIRRLFATAKKYANRYGACVIFLDELDAIGGARGGVDAGATFSPMMGGFRGGMGVMAALLSGLDGLEGPPGLMGWLKKKWWGFIQKAYIAMGEEPPMMPKPDYTLFVLGSTNRAGVLDIALVRAGRLEDERRVLPPALSGLVEVIEYYLAKVKHEEDIKSKTLSLALKGATPADVMSAIMRRAPMRAVVEGRECITEADVILGYWESHTGAESPVDDLHKGDQLTTAIHEAGHAVTIVSIVPELMPVMITAIQHVGTRGTGASLGMVVPRFREERQSVPLDFLYRNVWVALAGREAVRVIQQKLAVGFGGDRNSLIGLMMSMIAEGAFGYAASLALKAAPDGGFDIRALPEHVQAEIDGRLEEFAAGVREVIERNREVVEALADVLLSEGGTLTASRITQFFEDHPVWAPEKMPWD